MASTTANMTRCGVSWYKMDEASGDLIDSKSSFVGTNNGTTVVSGYSGNARSFNGTSNYILFNNPIVPLGKKSIRFRFKKSSMPLQEEKVLTNCIGSSEHGDNIYFTPAGNIWFQSSHGINGVQRYLVGGNVSSKLLDNKWHEVLMTWDGTTNANGVKIYVDDMVTPLAQGIASSLETTLKTRNLQFGRDFAATPSYYFKGQLDEIEIYNDLISTIPDKSLVFHDGKYKYYSTVWNEIGQAVTGNDYITNGMDDISTIPESAWKLLSGNVEICYYSDDSQKTEAQFNIETEPFTLADEWEGQTIKVIEYTDNPQQSESSVTIETEPFTLYDEFGDSVDVLFYSDEPTRSSADLELLAKYSPLDEINEDFEVVTYVPDELSLESSMNLNYSALPKGQLIVHEDDLEHYGDIQSIVVSKVSSNVKAGTVRLLLSFNGGTTWKAYKKNKWIDVYTSGNTSDRSKVVKYGMTIDEINAIPMAELTHNERFRLAYYLDESVLEPQEAKIGVVKARSKENLNDVKFSSMAFYLLNTQATINITFSGNRISGVLDDEDKTKVRYRAKLNGNAFYPANGGFTKLQDSPHDIKLIIDDEKIRFGESNTLIIEFEDTWGNTDTWQTTFIGDHSGLLFSDESGSFFTTGFGQVLKKLDFGQIIAGTTTLDQKVRLINRLGYSINNIRLDTVQPQLSGVVVEMSKEQSPFIALTSLVYPEVLEADDEVEFYVRISTTMTADETPSGQFEVRVNVDRVAE